ncbi:hypothetical protein PU629_02550 [Pullulanibacillus sp. KACC 23026]|uniref:hypothetical protein n=1 Tax=Pullulanibacillus sp. KACC 23026 TaxID=3028315 RepID=UPI0023AE78D1|nr:hypothetical protein [Pullulanibacillus sp. KACC 23026]WEG13265.1 hypothetical protein PU629_02550 [Pullulanibacillus sp. KACC 23026]
MILYLPKHFDQNEWFIIIIIVLSIFLYLLLPKRFPTVITAIQILYSIALPKILDHTIAVNPYNLYDLTDSSKYELFDLIMYAIYPPFVYLFIFLYDYFHLKGIRFVLYIIAWSFFAIGIEFIANRLHVYNYHGWKLIYSLPLYTFIMLIDVLLYHFCIKCYKESFHPNPSNK